MRATQPNVDVTAGNDFILNAGTSVRSLKISLRVCNQSLFIWKWTWGSNSGILYAGMIDVLYPTADADGRVRFTAIEMLTPAQNTTLNQVLWETAIEERFPGVYPLQMTV